jgi:alkylated DNA repair protein (DNA oxidative demethylase)
VTQTTFAFDGSDRARERETLAPGAIVLRGFAAKVADTVLAAIEVVAQSSPFRRMSTRGGRRMSVAMTNCGPLGWLTDARGYRYEPLDPDTGRPWPPMPASIATLGADAARAAGYADFAPDACLVNRYEPGARMALHQDRDERDFAQPIVSVSFGLPVTFQFGGLARTDPTTRVTLTHGDVVVFGGASRLCFHGVLPLKDGVHPLVGRARINLTLRVAGVPFVPAPAADSDPRRRGRP